MFSTAVILKSLPLLVKGAGTTLWVSAASLGLGFLLAVGICLLQLSHRPGPRRAGTLYISFFRGVPLLVQLLLVFYLLPFIGIDVPPLVAAIAALALCTAAYMAEILRGGFLGVPGGQLEAARLLGFRPSQVLWRIRVPLALRLTMPALVNECTMILKASSLISVVGVAELTRVSQNIVATSYRPLEIYLAGGVLYLVLNLALSGLGLWLQRRLGAGR
ncbi:amino acid ABC transporter permease [Inquilinus sp. NPDC058860]|uniref:amino acid ABC transporter permease n=1 Tax=Inquilinus sp. NPDC058860 TaxID=3346652 RepID=UPI00367BACCC